MKEYLNQLIEELVTLGESVEDLSIWTDLFDGMEDDEQAALIANLEQEREDLKKIS